MTERQPRSLSLILQYTEFLKSTGYDSISGHGVYKLWTRFKFDFTENIGFIFVDEQQ